MAQGDDNSTREGRKIKLKSIHGRFAAYNTGVTATIGETVRVIVYMDIGGSDVISTLQSASYLSFLNMNYTPLMVVLYDGILRVEDNGNSATTVHSYGHEIGVFNRRMNHSVHWNNTTAM